MRTDVAYNRKSQCCHNSSLIGYSTNKARVGSWIVGKEIIGRMYATVEAPECTYIAVVALSDSARSGMTRWIKPEDVRECYYDAPASLMAFICGDWPNRPEFKRDPSLMGKLIEHGTVSDLYIDKVEERIAKFAET